MKENHRTTFELDEDLYQLVRAYAYQYRLTVSGVLREAVRTFIKQWEENKKGKSK